MKIRKCPLEYQLSFRHDGLGQLDTVPRQDTLAVVSRLAKLMSAAFLALAAFGLLLVGPRCEAQSAPGEKIALRILYVGHVGSSREADFLAFLKEHFRQVNTGDLASFSPKAATEADVVLFDYDGDGFKAPRPRLPNDYSRPTVTIGVAGGMFASQRGLKSGYM